MKNILIKFLSMNLLIGLCASTEIFAQTDSAPNAQIGSETRKLVIETFIRDLNENYVFPETAKKIEADLRARLEKNEYEKITSAPEFAEKLTEQIQAISRDKHLRVRFSPEPIPVRAERSEPTEEERIQYLKDLKRMNYGFQKIERLEGNIGYVDLRGFMDSQLGAKTVEAAMNFLSNTDALIFDLRYNGGGSPAMVALISSYLFGDKPVHLNNLYWRKADRTDEFWTKPESASVKFDGKDIYVLTSRRTFSGAEEFSYNLKNLKRATIVGETTGGGAHPGAVFRLDTHFGAFISTGRAISPITKTNWEGTGVEPDVKVPKEQALLVAHISALENSAEKTENKYLKEALLKLIEKKKSELTEIKKTEAVTGAK